jgi:hypothetical protein
MINKLYGVLKITSSGEYNIYSAYLNDNLVYNKGNQGSLLNPPFDSGNDENHGEFITLRNPPFTEGFGQDSSKSFAENLESKLNLYRSEESDSGKE